MKLTEHFRLREFRVSNDHPGLAKVIQFSDIEIERIRFACASIFEPLRLRFGPVIITSGKRSPALNDAVGGHPQSHHMFQDDHGATDFTIPGAPVSEVTQFLMSTCRFRYLIRYPAQNFWHISYPDSSGEYQRYWEK